MKEDDLNRLEHSDEVKRIVDASKVLYDKDKSANTPRSFDSLMKEINRREGTPRKVAISPWWLVAACLIGVLIGWNFPFEDAPKNEKLALNDTVYITEKHTDTIYQQVQVERKAFQRKERREAVSARQMEAQTITPPIVRNEMSLPDLKSIRPATSGRSLAQENFPIHLLVSL